MIVERGKFIFINFVIAVLLLCFFGAFDSLMATCCNDEPKATNLPSFYWDTATIAGFSQKNVCNQYVISLFYPKSDFLLEISVHVESSESEVESTTAFISGRFIQLVCS